MFGDPPPFKEGWEPNPETDITCEECGSSYILHTDFIEVLGEYDEFLGRIYSSHSLDDWNRIVGGECPICNEWEDGKGNTCTDYGWELYDPYFGGRHGIANLIDGGWEAKYRDELQEQFNLSGFEADAYSEALKNYKEDDEED